MLYLSYKGKQVDVQKLEEIVTLQTHIENQFSIFRAELAGQKVTDNELNKILTDSVSDQEVRDAWIASKQIGGIVADDVVRLVKMRNAMAQDL
jgi:peptidyl-dipeptidase A